MGISFKVSKTGKRFRLKPHADNNINYIPPPDDDTSSDLFISSKVDTKKEEKDAASLSSPNRIKEELEVSFTLSLFSDGYSIGKATENETVATLQGDTKLLHPYDRASETLFSAIESGLFPGEILDDTQCKYVDGTIVCEVRDYRSSASESVRGGSCLDGPPVTHKICLRMSLENVVKDIPLISDDSWTYGDLMEVESRILKALQPQLCLDPTPKLERLSSTPGPKKLNLDLRSLRKKRLREPPEVTVTSNKILGKKVCIDRVPESSHGRMDAGDFRPISGDMQYAPGYMSPHNFGLTNMLAVRSLSVTSDTSVPASPLISHQLRNHIGSANARPGQEHVSGRVFNPSGASLGQDMISYMENVNSGASSGHGKRENQEAQLSPLSSYQRTRIAHGGSESMQQQQIAPHLDGLQGSNMQWKNTILQQQMNARGMQYANSGMEKYLPQMFEGIQNHEGNFASFATGQQGVKLIPKEEQIEMEKLDRQEFNERKNDLHISELEANNMDPQQVQYSQRLPPHATKRPGFAQMTWNNLSQHLDKDSRRDDQLQRRKSVQSPRLSAGAMTQSPLSSKSGEFSTGSLGSQYGVVASTAGFGTSQKEKSAITSIPSVAGTPPLASSDSMQHQHQGQLPGKRRSNSLPKTQAMSGVGSPASVSNTSGSLNASSPQVANPYQNMLDRFSKIEMVTMRHRINCKKSKIDDYPMRKPRIYSAQSLAESLSNASNLEDFKDEACPLSKSIMSGSMNTCKTRVLHFMQAERGAQGNVVSVKARNRLIMSEKPNDGTVAMCCGEIDYNEFLAAEDFLPSLANTHLADVLASQFCLLMVKDGYLMEDHIQPKPIRVATNSQSGPSNNPPVEMQQYTGVSGQPSNEVAKPTVSGTASFGTSHNHHLASTRMLPPGNTQALHISQGLMSGVSVPTRPQQLDQQLPIPLQQSQQQSQQSFIQQQHPQFQRSLMMGTSPLSHPSAMGQNSSMQMGNHMTNSPSNLQLQMLQQQQQQQQQHQQQSQQSLQMQKKMMGLGALGNMSNSMVGLGGLSNVIGMGSPRGIGGSGISSPMGGISGIANLSPNSMNLSQASSISNATNQQFCGLTPQQQAQLMQSKMLTQNRANMLAGSQSTIPGMSGPRAMHPGPGLAMLGQSLNRASLNPLQPAAMGPPKVMSGMNLYMNPQQQLQMQQQMQQQQQQQQQQLVASTISHQQQMQLQQQLQRRQQQQQQQQQHQQQQQKQPEQLPPQQETASPLQAVVAPMQVGSPTTVGTPQQLNQQQPQQQASPQQMGQRTPLSPQMSSGAIHPMNIGNPEVGPASPQLSSQTLGSVGSITNSPMDLQGANKSSSNA